MEEEDSAVLSEVKIEIDIAEEPSQHRMTVQQTQDDEPSQYWMTKQRAQAEEPSQYLMTQQQAQGEFCIAITG